MIGVITPGTYGRAIELGNRLWCKKLLPVGSISYKGRKIDFTLPYLHQLADAFHGGRTTRCCSSSPTPPAASAAWIRDQHGEPFAVSNGNPPDKGPRRSQSVAAQRMRHSQRDHCLPS